MTNSIHLKRHNSPRAWGIRRKGITFISKPNPGSFKRKYSTSILILFREILKYAKTTKEVKTLIRTEEILLNGKKVNDIKTPCGIFDIIEIKKTNEKLRLVFNEFGNFKLVPIKKEVMYLRLTKKISMKNKKFQLGFMNGHNLLCDEKTFKSIKVNDTIVYDYKKKKIESICSLKEGAYIYIIDGNFQGKLGVMKSITHYNGLSKDVCEIQLGKELKTTAKKYCFVVGMKKEDVEDFK